jgi:hypothetical protein
LKADRPRRRCDTVSRAILGYLVKCPDAKDTIEGIRDWWLPRDFISQEKITVQDALNFLVSRGWVTERRCRSADKIYGLNKNRLKEIQDFLRKPGNGK